MFLFGVVEIVVDVLLVSEPNCIAIVELYGFILDESMSLVILISFMPNDLRFDVYLMRLLLKLKIIINCFFFVSALTGLTIKKRAIFYLSQT
jgi:hypothetical protein